MRDISGVLISLLGALVLAQTFVPRLPRWWRIAQLVVGLPAFAFLFYCRLYQPILAPVGRDLQFAMEIGSTMLMMTACITALIRRPWDRRAKVG